MGIKLEHFVEKMHQKVMIFQNAGKKKHLALFSGVLIKRLFWCQDSKDISDVNFRSQVDVVRVGTHSVEPNPMTFAQIPS